MSQIEGHKIWPNMAQTPAEARPNRPAFPAVHSLDKANAQARHPRDPPPYGPTGHVFSGFPILALHFFLPLMQTMFVYHPFAVLLLQVTSHLHHLVLLFLQGSLKHANVNSKLHAPAEATKVVGPSPGSQARCSSRSQALVSVHNRLFCSRQPSMLPRPSHAPAGLRFLAHGFPCKSFTCSSIGTSLLIHQLHMSPLSPCKCDQP